jgi:hypothetical protein
MLRLVLALWIGSAALIVSAIGYGRSYALTSSGELQALNLDTCDGNPCFLNITPGITGWSTAETVLAKWDAMNAYDTLIVHLDDVEIRTWPSFDRSKVWLISVRRRPNVAVSTLGEVLMRYGSPCAVRLIGLPYQSMLLYPRISVTAAPLRGRFSPNSPVYDIQLVEPSFLFKAPSNLCESGDQFAVIPWAGFASVSHYQARLIPTQVTQ